MGEHDIHVKKWLSDKTRFADLFNAGLFSGRQLIQPEHLSRIESESGVVLRDKQGKNYSLRRFRDLAMRASGIGTNLCVLACENQEEVHYAMPVREMLYDAINYTEQIREKTRENRKKRKWGSRAEFLSGIHRQERLIPVLNLIFYYGDKPWDACLDLHSLLGLEGEESDVLKTLIPNYRIHLVDAKKLGESELLKSDLQWILGMLRYKNQSEELVSYVKKNEDYFSSMDEDSYAAAGVLLGFQAKLAAVEKETGGGINMCKALDDLYEEGVRKGRIQALIEAGQEFGQSYEATCKKVREKFLLEQEEAEAYMREYWKGIQ